VFEHDAIKIGDEEGAKKGGGEDMGDVVEGAEGVEAAGSEFADCFAEL
jgi:hypothetical protein